MKTKKIIKALKVLKKYCKKQVPCMSCEFYCIGFCGGSPCNWDLEGIEKKLETIAFLDRCALIDKLEEERVRRKAYENNITDIKEIIKQE